LVACATMSFVAVVLQDTEYWPASGGVTAYQINNALILPLAAQVSEEISIFYVTLNSISSIITSMVLLARKRSLMVY